MSSRSVILPSRVLRNLIAAGNLMALILRDLADAEPHLSGRDSNSGWRDLPNTWDAALDQLRSDQQ